MSHLLHLVEKSRRMLFEFQLQWDRDMRNMDNIKHFESRNKMTLYNTIHHIIFHFTDRNILLIDSRQTTFIVAK